MGKDDIFMTARRLFAQTGYDGLRMRALASALNMPLSVLYHYFPSKDALLEEIFHQTNRELGQSRKVLAESSTGAEALRALIAFQFAHAEQVVAVLKYYLHFRQTFPKRDGGFLPEKSALHVEEVLRKGMETGEFEINDLPATSKVIAHAINGFLLEYYPASVHSEDLDRLVGEISNFILRSLEPRTPHHSM